MGFKATVDLLILNELKLQAVQFAEGYDPELETVVLVPCDLRRHVTAATWFDQLEPQGSSDPPT